MTDKRDHAAGKPAAFSINHRDHQVDYLIPVNSHSPMKPKSPKPSASSTPHSSISTPHLAAASHTSSNPKSAISNLQSVAPWPDASTKRGKELIEEAGRRVEILAVYAELVGKGSSGVAAARQLNISPASIWRWKTRLIKFGLSGLLPNTGNSGRRPKFKGKPVRPSTAIRPTVCRMEVVLKHEGRIMGKFPLTLTLK